MSQSPRSTPAPEKPLRIPSPLRGWFRAVVAVVGGLAVPGLGHWFAGRARRGLGWFTILTVVATLQAVAALTDTSIPLSRPIPGVDRFIDWVMQTLLPQSYARYVAGLATVWFFALIDALWLFVVPLLPPVRRWREKTLNDAARHFLRGEYDAALRELGRLRMRLDAADPIVCKWTALTLRTCGQPRRALKYAKRPSAARCDKDFERRFADALRHEADVIAALLVARS